MKTLEEIKNKDFNFVMDNLKINPPISDNLKELLFVMYERGFNLGEKIMEQRAQERERVLVEAYKSLLMDCKVMGQRIILRGNVDAKNGIHSDALVEIDMIEISKRMGFAESRFAEYEKLKQEQK